MRMLCGDNLTHMFSKKKKRWALCHAPEAEKQWCCGDRYAFSCTVDLLDVRHLLRQYSNTLPQRPVSGLCSAGWHV